MKTETSSKKPGEITSPPGMNKELFRRFVHDTMIRVAKNPKANITLFVEKCTPWINYWVDLFDECNFRDPNLRFIYRLLQPHRIRGSKIEAIKRYKHYWGEELFNQLMWILIRSLRSLKPYNLETYPAPSVVGERFLSYLSHDVRKTSRRRILPLDYTVPFEKHHEPTYEPDYNRIESLVGLELTPWHQYIIHNRERYEIIHLAENIGYSRRWIEHKEDEICELLNQQRSK